MLRAAVDLVEQFTDAAIVVFTRSGDLGRLLSAQRPKAPIFAFTDVKQVFDQMLILWGVEPFLWTSTTIRNTRSSTRSPI